MWRLVSHAITLVKNMACCQVLFKIGHVLSNVTLRERLKVWECCGRIDFALWTCIVYI
jgi:hypothetical protein